MSLYTKKGRPLQASGDRVYSRSGRPVGRVVGAWVYGTDGRYVGTIANGRLVYRSTDSEAVIPPFAAASLAPSSRGHVGAVGTWGDEPDIPD
jgi:hypothetical protein